MAFHKLLQRSTIGLLVLTSASAFATEYFVASNGSDANPGTASAPFATISKAAAILQPGDVCTIFGGTYRETVAPINSGTSSAPILFRAASGQTVTISGLDLATASPIGNGKFTIPLSNALPGGQLQLFLSGKPLPEARYPNVGPDIMRSPNAVMASATASGNTVNMLDPKLTQSAGAWVGARVRYNTLAADQTASGYVFQGGVVTRSTPGNVVFESTGAPAYTFKTNENQYSLVGVAAAMDQNGEWYARNGTATLLDNSRPQTPFPIEVRNRVLAIDLWHKSFVAFKGVNLLGATVRTSVLSNGDTLDGITATYYSFLDTVESGFYGAWDGLQGIQMLGNNHTVKNSVFRFAEGNAILLKGNGSIVDNNIIENTGYYGCDAAAVKIYGGQNEVTNNTLVNCGRHLIRFSDGGSNILSNNEIYNGGLNTSDCGGIYAWFVTEGSTISGNYLHDLLGPGVGMGAIYIDHNCTNMQVTRNVMQRVRSGIRLNTPTWGNLIANNTVDTSTTHSLRSWPAADLGGSTIANNYFPTWINPDFSNGTWNNNATTPTDKFISPLIGDFRPSLGSPLIDAGTTVAAITLGFLGLAPDIGAIEFNPLSNFYASPNYGAKLDTAPTSVSNVLALGDNGQVTITWAPRPNTTSYRIYRSYARDGGFTLVGSVTDTAFSDTRVDRGVDTYYYVTAVNSFGESVISEIADAVPAFDGNGTGLIGKYFTGVNLTGSPVLTRTEAIDFNWGQGSPSPSVPIDMFSTRWTGFVEAPVTGTYWFRVNADDGWRLTIDGNVVAENWTSSGASGVATVNLVAGVKYDIKLEYFEVTGNAHVQLLWTYPNHPLAPVPASRLYVPDLAGLNANYFSTWNLDARQYNFYRIDNQINFDWGYGSPDPSIPVDLFSARYTGTIFAPTAGAYTFTATADNMVRVWINDQLIIDKWVDSAGVYTGTINIPARGRYNLKVEYCECGTQAHIILGWAYPGQTYQVVPAANLTHAAP